MVQYGIPCTVDGTLRCLLYHGWYSTVSPVPWVVQYGVSCTVDGAVRCPLYRGWYTMVSPVPWMVHYGVPCTVDGTIRCPLYRGWCTTVSPVLNECTPRCSAIQWSKEVEYNKLYSTVTSCP